MANNIEQQKETNAFLFKKIALIDLMECIRLIFFGLLEEFPKKIYESIADNNLKYNQLI